jgi:molybdate transport system substrate-binding protein
MIAKRSVTCLALLAWLALVLPCCLGQGPREIHVLAAADLQPVLPALAAAFEHATGIKLIASYGSSATLAAQILNGDPADLFLAADSSFPENIVAAGLADTPSTIPYARGTLVLWARNDSPLQPLNENTLRDGKFTSLAIANPDHAPYGRAAVAALTSMQLYDQLKPRLVIAENISQAAQFVESGNAQVGFIALAHAVPLAMRGEGKFWKVPAEAYPALDQGVVVLSHSQHKPEAAAFVNYIKTKDATDVLRRYGFTVPEK